MAEYIDKSKLDIKLVELCKVICQYSDKQRATMCSSCELGIAFEVIDEFPIEDVHHVVRCKDCKHRPKCDDDYQNGFDIIFPDDVCPLQCEDGWYNSMPTDNWFCANGEGKDGENGETQ